MVKPSPNLVVVKKGLALLRQASQLDRPTVQVLDAVCVTDVYLACRSKKAQSSIAKPLWK